MTYRDAIDSCLPKDPRSIYAYFKLGVMLAKRRNNINAWREASTFLRGYKKYLVAISTIMLEEHLLNGTKEENNESVLPYLWDVLHKAESIPGGKQMEEPRTFYNLARLHEYGKNYTQALGYYMQAYRTGERRGDRETFEKSHEAYVRVSQVVHNDDDDDDDEDESDKKKNDL